MLAAAAKEAGEEWDDDDFKDEEAVEAEGAEPAARRMTTVMLFGDQKALEIAERMIMEVRRGSRL